MGRGWQIWGIPAKKKASVAMKGLLVDIWILVRDLKAKRRAREKTSIFLGNM